MGTKRCVGLFAFFFKRYKHVALFSLRYQQKFDLEGDTGIVVRGIGTAVTLVKAKPTSTELQGTIASTKE